MKIIPYHIIYRLLTLAFILVGISELFAQTPGIPYQAYIITENASSDPEEQIDVPLTNAAVMFQFEIIDEDEEVEYIEQKTITTDEYGMVSSVIGIGGTKVLNTFDDINWDGTPKKMFIYIDFSATGGDGFQEHGVMDIIYIPGQDNQKGTEVALAAALDVDGDGTEETNVEDALIKLKTSSTDDQNINALSLSGTGELSIEIEDGNTKTVDLSSIDTDDQKGTEVALAAALDVHDDNKPETTVEAALIALNTELSTLRDALEELELAVNPPGTIIAWTGSTDNIPEGYLLCHGDSVSKSEYNALFTAIGISFGDNGSMFDLPDYRGMFLRGAETDGTRDVNTPQMDTIKGHEHSLKLKTINIGKFGHKEEEVVSYDINDDSYDTGKFGGTETRPKNWSVHFLIKY